MTDAELYDDEDLSEDEYSDSDSIRFRTKCPARLADITSRFEPLDLLAQQDIPCIVFGEDALALVFWVPTAVCALHIVVADADRERAVGIITSSLLFERFGPDPGPASISRAFPILERSAFAHSVYLKAKDNYRDPPWIIVHPATPFGLDVSDSARLTQVDTFPDKPFNSNIRLPQPYAMVDAIIDTLLEHGEGILSVSGGGQLVVWLASIVDYGFRTGSTVPGEGQDARSLLCQIKEENRAYFEAWIQSDKSRAIVNITESTEKPSWLASSFDSSILYHPHFKS